MRYTQDADVTILPRHEPGVDHGSTGKLLFDDGEGTRLIWRHACSSWVDRMVGHQPYPAQLILEVRRHGSRVGLDLHSGGRLSKKLLDRLRSQIVPHFGDWGGLNPLKGTIHVHKDSSESTCQSRTSPQP